MLYYSKASSVVVEGLMLGLMANDKPGEDSDWLRVQEELPCLICRELNGVACISTKRSTRSVSGISSN